MLSVQCDAIFALENSGKKNKVFFDHCNTNRWIAISYHSTIIVKTCKRCSIVKNMFW